MPFDAARLRDALRRARELNVGRRYPELARHLEDVPGDDLLAEPELGFLRADVLRRVGRSAEALELVRELAPICARRGNDRLARNRTNLEGMLLFEAGRVEDAESLWLELLDAASRADDDEFAARANNNLGVVATLRDRPERALVAYERAVAAYHRVGHLRGLAQSHQNLAITYREMGFLREADRHFRRAAAYARRDESPDELARVEQERALLHYFRGDAAVARITARRALDRFLDLDDAPGAADARRVVGIVALGEGRRDEARRALEKARAGARDAGAALVEAEVLLALSALEGAEGRESEAAARADDARERFRGLGAEEWGERMRLRLGRVAAGRRPVEPPGAPSPG